jgi:hypothetical protein
MTTLRDFISSRKAEIRAQMKALRKELADLKVAEDALGTQSSSGKSEPPTAVMTIKGMIREVLKSSSKGLTSTEILEGIDKNFGKKIERTSLSPQLSRMKEDGEVSLQGNFWVLSLPPSDQDLSDNLTEFEGNSGGFGDPNAFEDSDFEVDFDSDPPF